jgi:anti-sigma-K factor RskA
MPKDALSAIALRYAAGDLKPAECSAFEAQLATDQEARDALAEAIRLSAQALHQPPPAPDRTFRAAIRERLVGWTPVWLRRRAYRGHPATWAIVGAAAVAACTVIGLALADRDGSVEKVVTTAPVAVAVPAASPGRDVALEPDDCDTVAEIWADLSTPERVEKRHDEELKWLQKLRDVNVPAGRAVPVSTATDPRER